MKLIISLIFILSSYTTLANTNSNAVGFSAGLDEFVEVDTNSVSCKKVYAFINSLNQQLSTDQQIKARCKTITESNGIFHELTSDTSKTILESSAKLCKSPKFNYDYPEKYFDLYVDQIPDGNDISRVGEFILNEYGITVIYENDNPYGQIQGLLFPVCD